MAYDLERAPGGFARNRETAESRAALIFGLILGAAILLSLALLLAGATGIVTSISLLGVGYVANRFANEHLDAGIRWGKGSNGEAKVGGILENLRREGYVVMHDLDKVVPGNVDHLVSGPTGAFMVETKFRRYEERDLGKAKRVASKLAVELQTPWVQPVMCFATRSYGPKRIKGVAVVGVDELLPYIRAQRNPVVPFDNLARFADEQ